MVLEKGIINRKEFAVGSEHSADQIGSGDLEVLGTPALAAFIENTCKESVAEFLTPDSTTVGTRLDLEHLKASKIGAVIECSSELTEIDGRIMTFQVTCKDTGLTIGRAVHTRVVVDRNRFMAGLNKQTKPKK